jgi:hypothetical protein
MERCLFAKFGKKPTKDRVEQSDPVGSPSELAQFGFGFSSQDTAPGKL